MERMPGLRVISNFGVGCDHIDLEGARRLGIPVGNTPGVLDATTADMTFTLLMAAARNVVRGDHFARGPDFIEYDPSFLLGQEVAGSIMGIVGTGANRVPGGASGDRLRHEGHLPQSRPQPQGGGGAERTVRALQR
jgi:glyoxylate reductase